MLPPTITQVPEFDKDMHKLRKFKTIEEDLERFKKVLLGYLPKCPPDTWAIPGFGEGFLPVYKAKKFFCKALNRGCQSGIRVIYIYNTKKNEILLIEIYFKTQQDNHDSDRIKKYLIQKN